MSLSEICGGSTENRSRLYKRFGISSDRLDKLHQFANDYLARAETELLQNDYQQALKLARAAWGYESRAYPDVKQTGNDVVNGVMFYLALLMPFAYFMERSFSASRTSIDRFWDPSASFYWYSSSSARFTPPSRLPRRP